MATMILALNFLVGPTASGKSDIALALAQSLDAEIISLDSMAVYRGLDIGTAKPTPQDRALVPHHLIDIADPWEPYTVARYLRDSDAAILDIISRGKNVLFVGGTGLYLKRFREGLFHGPAETHVRLELQRRAETEGAPALYAELERLDPATAARLHPNDARRIIRALEVCLAAGRPMSELQSEHRKIFERERRVRLGVDAVEYRMLALRRERAELDTRIQKRTRAMFAAGLVDETRRLAETCAARIPRPADLPQSWRLYLGKQTSRALGYFDVLRHLNREITLDEARQLVYTHTRQFAGKQMTWFRSFAEMRWLDLNENMLAADAALRALKGLRLEA
jgi:tRNA dimethylallyltransferase